MGISNLRGFSDGYTLCKGALWWGKRHHATRSASLSGLECCPKLRNIGHQTFCREDPRAFYYLVQAGCTPTYFSHICRDGYPGYRQKWLQRLLWSCSHQPRLDGEIKIICSRESTIQRLRNPILNFLAWHRAHFTIRMVAVMELITWRHCLADRVVADQAEINSSFRSGNLSTGRDTEAWAVLIRAPKDTRSWEGYRWFLSKSTNHPILIVYRTMSWWNIDVLIS